MFGGDPVLELMSAGGHYNIDIIPVLWVFGADTQIFYTVFSRTPTAQNRLYEQGALKAPSRNLPQRVAPPREVMSEVSVVPSYPVTPGQPGGGGTATQEQRKTISLPEECSKCISFSIPLQKLYPPKNYIKVYCSLNSGFSVNQNNCVTLWPWLVRAQY